MLIRQISATIALSAIMLIGLIGSAHALTPYDVFGGQDSSGTGAEEPQGDMPAEGQQKTYTVITTEVSPGSFEETTVYEESPVMEARPATVPAQSGTSQSSDNATVPALPATTEQPVAGNTSSDESALQEPLPQLRESAPTPMLNLVAQIVSIVAVTGFAGGVFLTLRKPPMPAA